MPTNRGLSKMGLTRALAARLGISLKESRALVDAFLETMTEALTDGDRVVMGGFGVLVPVMRGGKRGRNPKTGEEVAVPPHRGVTFHMASASRRRSTGSVRMVSAPLHMRRGLFLCPERAKISARCLS